MLHSNDPPASQSAVMGVSNLLVHILTAANAGNIEEACDMAMRWCATHKEACTDETWVELIRAVFPKEFNPQVDTAQSAKARFLALCRKTRKDRYLAKHSEMSAGVDIHSMDNAEALNRIAVYLRNNHNYDLEDDAEFNASVNEFVYHEDDQHEEFMVWTFVRWAMQFKLEAIKWLLEAGYLHVDTDLIVQGVMNDQDEPPPFLFRNPDTLLGIAAIDAMSPAAVALVLYYEADPNAVLVEWIELRQGDESVAPGDLSYEDEGAAVTMAFHNLTLEQYATSTDTGDYSQASEEWRKKEADLFAIYKLLHEYGGNVLDAALMYQAYGLAGDNDAFTVLAVDLLKLISAGRARFSFAIYLSGGLPQGQAAQECMERQVYRMRKRNPFAPEEEEEGEDEEEDSDTN